jgi:PIN domain nuclease of toxin-antitoxin system
MIVLDTHIWIWWVQGDARLTAEQRKAIRDNEEAGLGISSISCWEIAKLVEKKRLQLPIKVEEWFDFALSYPGIELIPITAEIAVASTRFPNTFSQDPADQLIAATALIHGCPLVTSDAKLLGYAQLSTVY